LKKRIAAILSLLMLLNVMFSAAWVHAAAYEFIDSAYSPEKGIYVVMGKDFTNNADMVQVWVSTDLENWKTKAFTKGGRNYGNVRTQQNLVWWPKEQVFVLALGGAAVYTSEDGLSWQERPNLKVAGSGTIVETNGDRLFLGGNNKFKIADSVDENNDSVVFSTNTNVYVKSLGITDEAPYQYMIGDKDAVYAINAEFKTESLSKVNMISMAPIDQAYAPGCNGWFFITTEAKLYYKGEDGADTNIMSLNGLPLAQGGTVSTGLTAIAVNSANDMLVGTDNGGLYAAAANGSYSSLAYTEVQPAAGTDPIDSSIGSISAVDENNFLFAAGSKFYIAKKQNNTYVYYTSDSISIGVQEDDLRIEIPAQHEQTFDIYPQVRTMTGSVSKGVGINSCTAVGDLPAGVTWQDNGDHFSLTVSADTEASEIIMRAVAENGITGEFTVTLVNEDHLDIAGLELIGIPLEGDDPVIYEYIAKVIGTDGKEMNRMVSITSDAIPDGVTLEGRKLTVTSATADGRITLNFTSVTKPELTVQKTVKLEKRTPDTVIIESGEEVVEVPDNGEKNYIYTAAVFDQSGGRMPREEVVWSISRDGQAVLGMEIDSKTGELTIKATASLAPFTLRAACAADTAVYSEKEIKCSGSDERSVEEDMALLEEALKLVTKDITLSVDGQYGTEISWKSGDENIIPASGEIICPTRKGASTQLTITVKKNDVVKTKNIVVKIAKAETIGPNCDIELGTTKGWNAAEGTMSISQDAHGGKYALSAKNEVYRNVNLLTNDSSYAFYVHVKAPEGTAVQIYSEIADQVIAEAKAEAGYTEIKGSYDYHKQKESFTDNIYIRVNGDFLVDDFRMFEITLEYDEAAKAVSDAEYSRKQTDIDNAQKVLDNFYDLPVRDELQKRLKAIVPKNNNVSGGGPGGGGSVPSSAGSNITMVYPAGENQSSNNYEDALDTALLKFKDMKGHWAKEDVEYMAGLSLVSGKEESVFAPDDTVTRAEFAVLVTRVMGLSAAEYENSFFDVISEDWYSGYVQAAKSAGYMNGSDGLFRPNDPISREEIAKVIVAAYNAQTNTNLEKGGALYFNDINEIGAWAYDYIVEAVNKGFIAGISEDIFAPKANATRAQAVVMLRRVYDELHGSSKAEGGN